MLEKIGCTRVYHHLSMKRTCFPWSQGRRRLCLMKIFSIFIGQTIRTCRLRHKKKKFFVFFFHLISHFIDTTDWLLRAGVSNSFWLLGRIHPSVKWGGPVQSQPIITPLSVHAKNYKYIWYSLFIHIYWITILYKIHCTNSSGPD